VTERKVNFRRPHSRVYNLKLTKEARGLLIAARNGCRDARVSAFVASRRLGRKRDDQRTTLVRHSKTLKHGRTSGCGAPAGPTTPASPAGTGVPGSPGAPPGLGGPSLDPPGTPPGGGNPPPAVPNDPITIRAGAADGDSTPPVGTPMFAYTARSEVLGADPQPPPGFSYDPNQPPGPTNPTVTPPSADAVLQFIGDPDENLYAKSFEPSDGIHTRIRARAIVIEAGGKKYALAMIDLGGHPLAFTQEVLRRVADTGITKDRLFLSSTHTHSSSGAIWSADNMGYGVAGGDVYDPRVFEMVVSGVVEAITEANKRLQPARIGVGTATLHGASRNRAHDAFQLNPDSPADEKADNNRAIDSRVTVVRVDDARGAPLGVWSNFAIHPTSFGDDNLLFSGDNAATTERLVEDELVRDAIAAGRPPAQRPVNVWTNGTQGDISPDGGTESDPTEPSAAHRQLEISTSSFTSANSAGRKVSRGIVDAWRDAGQSMSGSPAIDARHTFMRLDGTPADGEPVGPVPVLGLGVVLEEFPQEFADGGYPSGQRPCAPVDGMAGPGQGKKFPLLVAPGGVPNTHPISLMKIGGLAIAAFPTEITLQAGRRIKGAINTVGGAQIPEGAVIAGLTNSYNSYTSTPEEYDFCHYEGGFTLFGRRQGARYRDLAGAMARSLFAGQALDPGLEPPPVSPGTPNQPSVRLTPNAGTIVTQPTTTVRRMSQARFRWYGGDPAVDAPRGRAFVTLEFETPSGFRPVSTDDSVVDTTQRTSDTVWNERWQFTECDAPGRYRFVVRGVAAKTGPQAPYTTTSRPFEVTRAGISVYSKKVENGVARVRAEYTSLPTDALTVLNRRVRHGFAVLRVTRPGGASEEVIAPIDSKGLEFATRVPAGASVDVVSIEDACGNTGS
jgi:neutral ceramidase